MKNFRFALVLSLAISLAQFSHAGTLVQFHFFFGAPSTSTYVGDVDVELYDQDKPVTVNNFIKLIEAGAYNGSFFHRLVPGFVLQGGGFGAFNSYSSSIMGPSSYTNVFYVGNFGNIPDEIHVGKFYSNTNWTIAMAKGTNANTANSQFFFNLANNASSLDTTNNAGGFTVFGHTLRGTNILNFFNGLYYGYGLFDLQTNYGAGSAVFAQLPADLTGTNPPPYSDLFYFTISILDAQVSVQKSGARQITWNTISGETNTVEYTTNLTGTWQVLTNIVPTNAVTTNILDSASSKTRYYRIKVLYPNQPPS